MGLYLRKSIKAGPFRVNLSKSGIGMSTGIPGLRVGSGPRGSYVRMGHGGVYYRKTLSSPKPRQSSRRAAPSTLPSQHYPSAVDQSDVVMEDITGARVENLEPAEPSDLLQQLNDAARAPSLMPLMVICYILIITIPLGLWLRAKNAARRTVVVFYDVNDGHATRFEQLLQGFEEFSRCAARWSVAAQGSITTTYQYKVNAGASHLLNRQQAKVDLSGPAILKTNIAVPSIQHVGRTVYFLPDRVLINERRSFTELSYPALHSTASATNFIESGTVPRDAQLVRTTWKYVNKKGGPDRRFKDNRQLPVLRYGELDLSSAAGFHALWQSSSPEAARALAAALHQMT